tara:strand:- start:4412 stop:4633 length:222 start_codon:yes stop_codon:yes gene_type:complete
MDQYKEHELTLRNLVKQFIIDYKDDNFNDNYLKANEFLLNYSFGPKVGKPDFILELENKYQKSIDKIIFRKSL